MSVEVWFGIRGGVGTTSAVRSRIDEVAGCIALDFDISRGDLAVLASIEPAATIASLASARPGDLTSTDVAAVCERFGHKGGRILASPAQPELVDFVTPELVEELIQCAGQLGPVVIDAGSVLDVTAFAALHCATRIVVVSRADTSCAHQLGRFLNLLDRACVRAPVELELPRSAGAAAQRFSRSAGLPLRPRGSWMTRVAPGRDLWRLRHGTPAPIVGGVSHDR